MNTYRFFINPFLSNRITYILQLEAGRYLKAALDHELDQPEMVIMANLLNPVLEHYSQEYMKTGGQKDMSLGNTRSFYDSLDLLPRKFKKWDHAIQDVFEDTTPQYLVLFPRGRSDLYRGKLTEKLAKVETFAVKLKNYPELSAVLTEVDSFSHILNEALSMKQNGYSITDESSETLYRSYQALAVTMYSILGRMIYLFAAEPLKCEHYFPMNILRTRIPKNGKQEENDIYTLSVPTGTSAPADLNFSSADKLLLYNSGEISVWYYGAASATATAPDNPAELLPDTEIEVSGAQLGAPLNKYLFFLNKDTKEIAEIEITLL